MTTVNSTPPVFKGISTEKAEAPKEIQDQNVKKVDDRKYIPKEFVKVAKGLEQQFAEMMINEMNKTTGDDGTNDGVGMDYYKSLQNTERAKTLTEQNQLGLQDLILDQIYPKRMRNEMALQQYQKSMERKFNHNLPTLNKPEKSDTISMKRNDSSEAASKAIDSVQVPGGLE